jgi:hypothetical protein
MHPVGVRAVEAIIPEGWPALDGTMVCATCHADPGCSPGRMPEPMYLRGGPFPSTREFCQVCHEPRAYTRADPHHPERVRDPEDHTCAACHVRPPTETDDALRGTADETCRVCHEGAVHGGTAEHMGVAPDPVPTGLPLVDGRIGCVTCHEVHDATAPPPPPSRLAEALRVHATTTDWAGLLPQDIAWPGTPRAEHPPMLALPLHDDALCGACHGEGPQ